MITTINVSNFQYWNWMWTFYNPFYVMFSSTSLFSKLEVQGALGPELLELYQANTHFTKDLDKRICFI